MPTPRQPPPDPGTSSRPTGDLPDTPRLSRRRCHRGDPQTAKLLGLGLSGPSHLAHSSNQKRHSAIVPNTQAAAAAGAGNNSRQYVAFVWESFRRALRLTASRNVPDRAQRQKQGSRTLLRGATFSRRRLGALNPLGSNSGGGIRTRDLRVMSPTSYQTAPPRVARPYYIAKRRHSFNFPSLSPGG